MHDVVSGCTRTYSGSACMSDGLLQDDCRMHLGTALPVFTLLMCLD